MSIYATWLALDGDHEEDCAVWVEVSPNCFEMGDADCTCGLPMAPYDYQGSHVLPALTDPRGSAVLVCCIPDHITRDGRDDGGEGPKDWLRLSVHGVAPHEGTVVLTGAQVREMRDTLTAWLEAEERA